MPRLLRSKLESRQKGKFFRRQKFALLRIRNQRKTQNFQGAESIKKNIYVTPIL
jgi:hypothetical protein